MDLKEDLGIVSLNNLDTKSVFLGIRFASIGAREAGTIERDGPSFSIANLACAFKALDGESAFLDGVDFFLV